MSGEDVTEALLDHDAKMVAARIKHLTTENVELRLKVQALEATVAALKRQAENERQRHAKVTDQ